MEDSNSALKLRHPRALLTLAKPVDLGQNHGSFATASEGTVSYRLKTGFSDFELSTNNYRLGFSNYGLSIFDTELKPNN